MLEYLRDMRWSPHVALVTMISSDHLAWHGSQEAYVDAKRNIIRFQQPEDIAVLNEDDPTCAGFALEAAGKIILYGLKGRKRFDLLIPGVHNQLNAQGAFTAASIFGVDFTQAQQSAGRFRGFAPSVTACSRIGRHHVLQRFDRDDSRSRRRRAGILSQQEGHPDRRGLRQRHADHGAVRRPDQPRQGGALHRHDRPGDRRLLEQSPSENAAATYRCGDLATAVTIARQIAASGDIVLLSPGFKSYDQFVNFEQRGDEFVKRVKDR